LNIVTIRQILTTRDIFSEDSSSVDNDGGGDMDISGFIGDRWYKQGLCLRE